MALRYWEGRHTTAASLRSSWLAFGKQFSQACALVNAGKAFRRLAQRISQRYSGTFSNEHCYGGTMRACDSNMNGGVAFAILCGAPTTQPGARSNPSRAG